jgi:hypothetical protein
MFDLIEEEKWKEAKEFDGRTRCIPVRSRVIFRSLLNGSIFWFHCIKKLALDWYGSILAALVFERGDIRFNKPSITRER